MPVSTYMCPSGLMMNRPSNPTEPLTKPLTDTPTPVTLVPFRCPLRAFFSSQPNSAAPLSSASFRKQLVV